MMTGSLKEIAVGLLASGKVEVVIGYGEGSRGQARPIFARNSEDADGLIFDQRCRANLAVYLAKPEVRKLGRAAVVATPAIVRSLIQLIAEHQLKPENLCVLAVDGTSVTVLSDAASLEGFAATHPVVLPPHVMKLKDSVARMSTEERREFWDVELSRCFKCYACRAACPLCYCDRCITDDNQPQWVCVAPHGVGVVEWHINRAMHMAGRCVQCGACTLACPTGIPIGLLPLEAARVAEEEFGYQAGMRCDAPAALSSFKVGDKESFIL
jgi:ferredoxin